MAPVRPTTTPPLLPKATDKTEAPKGDYSVKKGDTLEKIATKLVTDSGGTATKANVAKALAALKKANPELVTAARDGGNKIRIGDQVKYPKLDAQGGWASAGAASNAGAPTKASAAAAKDQMGTLKLDKELTEAARTFSTKRPTADEAKQLNGLLERIKTDAPKLLDTPAARVLRPG